MTAAAVTPQNSLFCEMAQTGFVWFRTLFREGSQRIDVIDI
jgi:hypothetical protein